MRLENSLKTSKTASSPKFGVDPKCKGLGIHPKPFKKNGAGEEIRTLDIDLGKVALYH